MRAWITISLLLLAAEISFAKNGDTIRIYFDLAVPSLNTAAMRYLDSLAYHDILRPGNRYGIIGYADYLGSEESNITLSQNRADNVHNYLQGLGIKPEHIETVTGKGEVTRDRTGGDGYPEDRRVDIVIGGFKEKIQPPPQKPAPVQAPATASPQKIDISQLKVGDVFDLENMFFESGSTRMIERSLPTLEALLEAMLQNPTVKIRIEGFVHCFVTTGSGTMRASDGTSADEATNKWQNMAADELSTGRAKMVRDYLVQNNISGTRLQFTGFGCLGSTKYKDNRRVSIRILEK